MTNSDQNSCDLTMTLVLRLVHRKDAISQKKATQQSWRKKNEYTNPNAKAALL